MQEVTAEGVEMLPQRCVVEGQDPTGIIQEHTDPQRLHRDAYVRRPAAVQELVLVPEEERSRFSWTRLLLHREIHRRLML